MKSNLDTLLITITIITELPSYIDTAILRCICFKYIPLTQGSHLWQNIAPFEMKFGGFVWNPSEFTISRIFVFNYGKFSASLLAFGLFIKMENRDQNVGRMTLFVATIQLLSSWPTEPKPWIFSEKLFKLQTSCRHKRYFKSTNCF